MGKKMQKFLALCLCMLMILSVVPKSVFAAENDEAITASNTDAEVEEAEEVVKGEAYDVWVGGVQVTTSNINDVLNDGGKVKFVKGSGSTPNKLILNGALIGACKDEWPYAAIVSYDDIEIETKGSNVIGYGDSIENLKEATIQTAIYARDASYNFKKVTISGDGSFYMHYREVGIWAKIITIKGSGVIEANEYGEMGKACCFKAASGGHVDIQGRAIRLSSYTSKCIEGEWYLNGGEICLQSYGGNGSTNTAIDHIPDFAMGYHPVVEYGDSSDNTKEASNPYSEEYKNAKYIYITRDTHPLEIYVNPTEHGTVKTNVRYAEEGDNISVTVDPEPGYIVDSFEILYGMSGTVEPYWKYDFVMPSADAIINVTFKEVPYRDIAKPLIISVLANNASGVDCILNFNPEEDSNTFETQWAISSDGGETWTVLSDFAYRNVLKHFDLPAGDYILSACTQVNHDDEMRSSITTKFTVAPAIKGICQMPNPNGSGFLIGIETKDDPYNEYTVEMLILDCTLLAKNEDAWIYTTGRCGTTDSCLWTIWDPQYGYYWTLFRVYDKDGNLVEEQCYGFENI